MLYLGYLVSYIHDLGKCQVTWLKISSLQPIDIDCISGVRHSYYDFRGATDSDRKIRRPCPTELNTRLGNTDFLEAWTVEFRSVDVSCYMDLRELF